METDRIRGISQNRTCDIKEMDTKVENLNRVQAKEMYLIKIFNLGLMYMYVSIYVRLDTSKCRRQHEKELY
jgi:hypothetical protein